MGDYSKGVSKRLEHTRIKDGYCLICGEYGRLSFDHVPPKGSITITKIEQRHITEIIGKNDPKVQGVISRNGSKFKTICQKCNNEYLGENDMEVARVCKELTVKINNYFNYANLPRAVIWADVDATKFVRAMIGHILSATTVEECKKAPTHSPYFQPLKNFVLGDDTAISETHDIYYWFYPYPMHLSAKLVSFYNEGHHALISLLSFFPVAFMVTKKNEGTYPAHSRLLQLTDRHLQLDLSFKGFEYAAFPFHVLNGNQMFALNDAQAIVSYPIGR